MGSHDLFGVNDRPLHSTINYITSHDGFTLADLVTYQQKHNEANRENNHDGHNGDESCNYGVEGPSDDPALNTLRQQQKRNLLATLLLSSGTPMISGGDEIGRSARHRPSSRNVSHEPGVPRIHRQLKNDLPQMGDEIVE